MRMMNKPELYQLNNTAAAEAFINQASVWLMNQAEAAAVTAVETDEAAATAKRAALKAQRLADAFTSVSSVEADTIAAVAAAAETLKQAAAEATSAAAEAAAKAAQLASAVASATNLPPINSWDGIK